MESYKGQEGYDYIQEYLSTFSSAEQVEEFKRCCKDVLAKREKEMIAIDTIDSPLPDTKKQKIIAESPESSNGSNTEEYDILFKKFSKFWIYLCDVTSNPESLQQLQFLGPDYLDALSQTQYAMNNLIITLLNSFPHYLPFVYKTIIIIHLFI